MYFNSTSVKLFVCRLFSQSSGTQTFIGSLCGENSGVGAWCSWAECRHHLLLVAMAVSTFPWLSEIHRFFTNKGQTFDKGERKYLDMYIVFVDLCAHIPMNVEIAAEMWSAPDLGAVLGVELHRMRDHSPSPCFIFPPSLALPNWEMVNVFQFRPDHSSCHPLCSAKVIPLCAAEHKKKPVYIQSKIFNKPYKFLEN